MIKYTLFAAILLMLGTEGISQTSGSPTGFKSTSAGQGTKKSGPVYATPTAVAPANPYDATIAGSFNEEAFIKEFLIVTSRPADFPSFDAYTDKAAFRRDLKKWIHDNPQFIKEEKRIQ